MLRKIASIKVTRLNGMKHETDGHTEGSTEVMISYLEKMAETAPRLGGSHTVKIEVTSNSGDRHIFNFGLEHPSIFDVRFEFNSKLYSVMRN